MPLKRTMKNKSEVNERLSIIDRADNKSARERTRTGLGKFLAQLTLVNYADVNEKGGKNE